MEICPLESKLVAQLRLRISDLKLTEETLQEKCLVRWIRARKGNLVAAEDMVRKHVEWKRQLITFEKCCIPVRWETDILPCFILEEDKEGLPVFYANIGRWNVEGAIRSEGEEAVRSFALKYLECAVKVCLSRTKGKSTMGQVTAIMDFEGLTFAQVTSYTGMQFVMQMVLVVEANYPELLRKGFCVNTPWTFQALYKVMRPFIDERTVNKLSMLGWNKRIFREEIGKFVPLNSLPKRYGGDLGPEKEREMRMSPNFDGSFSKWGMNNNC